MNLPAEIKTKVQESGLADLSEAEKIASNYVPFMEQVKELTDRLKPLKQGNEEHVEIAKRVRIDLGKISAPLNEIKKKDKEAILIRGRYIDGLYNTVNGAKQLGQEQAKEYELYFERIEQKKRDELREKRKDELSKYDVEVLPEGLEAMPEEVWLNYLDGVKVNYKLRKDAEEKAERERIENEKKKELHNKRKEQILPYWDFVPVEKRNDDFSSFTEKEWQERFDFSKKQKEDYDSEQERIRKENEELKKQAALREQAQDEERKKREKIEAELKAKKEAEENAKKQEEARIQAELNKGDSEKVKDLISDLDSIKSKYAFKSKKNKAMHAEVCQLIDKIVNHIKSK